MRATRKVTRELRQQARKTFRVALRDKIILDEYNKRFRDGFDVGFEKGVKATYEHINASKDSGVVSVVSEKQLVDMLKEGT